MNAKDIMVAPVITVAPDTPMRHIASLLAEHHISGIPVLANGRVIGIVNEYELLRRFEIGTESSLPSRPWLKQLFERDLAAADYVRSHGQHAEDFMSLQVVSASENTPVQKIASMFGTREIRRIIIMRKTELVGIVTRADLVKAVARSQAIPAAGQSLPDEQIRQRLIGELEQQPWWRPGQSVVSVTDGVVNFQGLIENEDERRAARVAAENVCGVRGVVDPRRHWASMKNLY